MVSLIAVICAAAATALLTGPGPGRVRLGRILHAVPHPSGRHGVQHARAPAGRSSTPVPRGIRGDDVSVLGSTAGRIVASALSGVGAAVFIGGGFGVGAGCAAAVAAWIGLGRVEPGARQRERERIQASLPLAADLLIAALAAGCAPDDAVEQVGRALGGPLGRTLVGAASAARVGADPARAWSGLTADAALRPLARALVSASVRGTSPVPALERAAQDARDSARWAAESRARSLGSRAAAPLGLCFLPAFILVGVVPVVASSGLVLP